MFSLFLKHIINLNCKYENVILWVTYYKLIFFYIDKVEHTLKILFSKQKNFLNILFPNQIKLKGDKK